jgi:hypothetical protein
MLWNRLQSADPHPLIAFLPDSEGDAPGVVRKLKNLNEERKRKLSQQPLPKMLKMHLGETKVLGALAITPLRVAWEKIGILSASGDVRPVGDKSLVLHLRLENVSEDQFFQPLDRYFDRRWREDDTGGPPPLTCLEAGLGRRFFGGPAKWRRRGSGGALTSIERVCRLVGDEPISNNIDQLLEPGQAVEHFVCIDGDDARVEELEQFRGEFLWRVHLRRGLVQVLDKEVPAAAVVGVIFRKREIAPES